MRLPSFNPFKLLNTFLRERFRLRHRSPGHSQEGGELTLVSSDFDGVLQIHGVPYQHGLRLAQHPSQRTDHRATCNQSPCVLAPLAG